MKRGMIFCLVEGGCEGKMEVGGRWRKRIDAVRWMGKEVGWTLMMYQEGSRQGMHAGDPLHQVDKEQRNNYFSKTINSIMTISTDLITDKTKNETPINPRHPH